MNMDIEVIKSKRKSLAIEIKTDLKVIVRVPFYMSDEAVEQFVKSRMEWIEKHIAKMKNEKRKPRDKLTEDEILYLRETAKRLIYEKAECYADIMGLKYGKITIKKQRSRWGSCSEKGNLNFNLLLAICPDDVIDYVVIHELSHLKEMNHSKEFWSIVQKYCPEYKKHKKWLKEHANELIERL